MKKIIPALALLLALALPLSGCAAMLERAWSGSETHVDYPVVEDDSTLRVGNYQGLVNALLYYVNEHSAAGSVQMYNYAGEAEEDLERARAQVVEQDPLAAYTVRSLTYDVTRILTYYEVDVRITYAHTAQEIDAIRTVSGMAGLTAELERMADEREGQSVLLLSGFSGDGALLDELFRLAWYGDPARGEPDPPRFQAGFYPAEGAPGGGARPELGKAPGGKRELRRPPGCRRLRPVGGLPAHRGELYSGGAGRPAAGQRPL